MITLLAGLNGQGKTIKLREIYSNLKSKYTVITNLSRGGYSGIDGKRFRLLSNEESFINIFDYHEIIKANDELVIITDDGENELGVPIYTKYFLDLITLLCRPGDILILDEPDFGISIDETNMLVQILHLLKDTYKEIYIATHCSRLFCLADKRMWVEGYKTKEITEEQLYGSIGTIRR